MKTNPHLEKAVNRVKFKRSLSHKLRFVGSLRFWQWISYVSQAIIAACLIRLIYFF